MVCANGMFAYTVNDVFEIDCPKLTCGDFFFTNNTNLHTVVADLSSLVYAYAAFGGCTSLERFYTGLPKLEYGVDMFSGCRLDDKSLFIIANSLNYV